jgi:hypothetical protein
MYIQIRHYIIRSHDDRERERERERDIDCLFLRRQPRKGGRAEDMYTLVHNF